MFRAAARSFLVIILSLPFAGAQARPANQEAQPKPSKPKTTAPAKQASPAPAAVKAESDFPGEPFVIERWRTTVRFDNDGTGRRESVVRIRVQSQAALQQLGILAFGYNSAFEMLEIPYVRVVKPDASVVTASTEAVQDLASQLQREAPVYTDFREKHVTVPALQPGDVLEYSTLQTIHTPVAPGHFWLEHEFADNAVVLEERLEVNVPAGRALKSKWRAGLEPQVSEEGGRRFYRWSHKNLKPKSIQEQVSEAEDWEQDPPAVQMSTFQSWDEVASWYAGLVRERAVPTPELKAKAGELTRGADSERRKVEALYAYVSAQVRYISLSFGLGRLQPHAAADVLKNQYGDCKDKHTLLATLLLEVGLAADVVLANFTRKLDPDVPSPAQFNHAFTGVALGTDYFWLDTTPEVAPFGHLLPQLRGKSVLRISTQGAPEIVTVPNEPPLGNFQSTEVEGKVDDSGAVTATVTHIFRGDSEVLMRTVMRRTPQGRWKDVITAGNAAINMEGEVSDLQVSDVADTTQPFRLIFKLTNPDFLDMKEAKPTVPVVLPRMNLNWAASPQDKKRAIRLPLSGKVTHRLRLDLPSNMIAKPPLPVSLTRDYALYRSTYRVEKNVVQAERELRATARQIARERYNDYNALSRAIQTDEAQTFSLEAPVVIGGLKVRGEEVAKVAKDATAEQVFEAAERAIKRFAWADGEKLLQRVLQMEPKHPKAWGRLAKVYGMSDRPKAIDAYRKQVEIDPYDEDSQKELAGLLWRERRYSEAEAALRKVLEISPLDANTHMNIGQLLVLQGRPREALEPLQTAVLREPQNFYAREQLVRAYLAAGEVEKGVTDLKKYVSEVARPDVKNNAAMILADANVEPGLALEYIEDLLRIVHPRLAQVDVNNVQDYDVAGTAWTAMLWDTLGWVCLRKGDVERAEQYLEAAWLLNAHPEVGDHLGQLYERQDRPKDAVRTYARALAGAKARPYEHEPALLERFQKLAGKGKQADALIEKGTQELQDMRTVRLGKIPSEGDSAELYMVFGPAGKVEAIQFIEGDEEMKALFPKLREVKYPVLVPSGLDVRITRRAVLSCSDITGCMVVLLPAEQGVTIPQAPTRRTMP